MNTIFPGARCPYPFPTSQAERYRPFDRTGAWRLITGSFVVEGEYGVLREAGTSEHILLYGIVGTGFVVTGRGWHNIRPGQAILIEPDQPHYYGATPDCGPWTFLWVHFFPHPGWTMLSKIPPILAGIRGISARSVPARDRIPEALQEAHALRLAAKHYEPLAMNALERALLWLAAESGPESTRDLRVRQTLEVVLSNPSQSHTVGSLARIAGLSPSRFAHLFREQTGETPQHFVERVRLDTAGEWLRAGGRTIAEISDALGFSSPFYFSRRFKGRFGVSPSHYLPPNKAKSPTP